jgi:hypothetical protein
MLSERIPEDSPIGHWAWSVGAVVGGNESMRGAGGPQCLRRPSANRRTAARVRLEALLAERLGALPRPLTNPVLLKDCRRCNTIHPFDEGSEPDTNCPAESSD